MCPNTGSKTMALCAWMRHIDKAQEAQLHGFGALCPQFNQSRDWILFTMEAEGELPMIHLLDSDAGVLCRCPVGKIGKLPLQSQGCHGKLINYASTVIFLPISPIMSNDAWSLTQVATPIAVAVSVSCFT